MLRFRDPQGAITEHDLDALSGGLGGEIAYLIQSVSNVMSGFLVSFIENWKITLLMMAAGPVLAIIQGISDKVTTQQFYLLYQLSEIKKNKKYFDSTVRDWKSRPLVYQNSVLTTELTRLTLHKVSLLTRYDKYEL